MLGKCSTTWAMPPALLFLFLGGLFVFCCFSGTGIWTWGFMLAKQVFYCLSHRSSPFCSGYFEDGILGTVCLGWPRTWTLLISVSQVARITGMSHQTWLVFCFCILLLR
jgi:hypothetical protein